MTPSSRRARALAAGLAAAAVLTGACTTVVDGAPRADPAPVPTEGPGSDPVVWADQVCAAVLSFVVPATSPPDFAASSDLPTVQRTFSAYLGTVASGAEQGRTRLAELGGAPEPAGDEAAGRAETAMGVLEEDFGGVQATVDGADTADPEAFLAALARAEARLADIQPPDPLGDLTAAPRLQRAAERAAQCQELVALSAEAPR